MESDLLLLSSPVPQTPQTSTPLRGGLIFFVNSHGNVSPSASATFWVFEKPLAGLRNLNWGQVEDYHTVVHGSCRSELLVSQAWKFSNGGRSSELTVSGPSLIYVGLSYLPVVSKFVNKTIPWYRRSSTNPRHGLADSVMSPKLWDLKPSDVGQSYCWRLIKQDSCGYSSESRTWRRVCIFSLNESSWVLRPSARWSSRSEVLGPQRRTPIPLVYKWGPAFSAAELCG